MDESKMQFFYFAKAKAHAASQCFAFDDKKSEFWKIFIVACKSSQESHLFHFEKL